MISRAAIEAAKKAAIAKAAEIDQTSVDTLDEESYRHLETVLMAALSAALAAEGIALVPVEPTTEQLDAMLLAGQSVGFRWSINAVGKLITIYRAMLKAAGVSDGNK